MNNPEFPNMNAGGQYNARTYSRTPPPKKPFNRRLGFWFTFLLIIVGILLFRAHYKNFMKAKHTTPPQSVVLSVAHTADVPVYLNGLGAVTPIYTVTVKTQINGQLQNVYFREGQEVKAGDLLAQIDPRPYEAQLTQYEGQLEHDSALLVNAQTDLKRYQLLWSQNSVSKQILDTQVATVQQDEGAVKTDEGLIAGAKLNLLYCRIVSPVDGRIGLRLVDPGNYVQVSDTTGLAVIATSNPTSVVFTLPEDNIPALMKLVYAGAVVPTEAYNRSQTELLSTGTLLAVDSQVDPTTGTVKLKALFTNTDKRLFPNQFVNIKMLVDTLKNAIVVPTAAIQNGANGAYIYVLNTDHKTVHAQTVNAGITVDNDTTITKGITSGQSVVIEGADKLTEGAIVTDDSPDSAAQEAGTAQASRHTKQKRVLA
jgi:multidrug efflux system membrane fusion protein